MISEPRRPARGQALPPEEVSLLHSLRGFNLYARALQLFNVGWTLRAIGEAYDPPKSRSTIRSWTERAEGTTPTIPLPPPVPPVLTTPGVYIPVRPPSPGISATDRDRIETLAPIARKFRAAMTPLHPAAQANTELTAICLRLVAADVPVRELADAAGVTYRAMAKRLGQS